MQSKGTLGSVVAGVIAIFLVLVCLFYISFTYVGNQYEKAAEAYAVANNTTNSPDQNQKLQRHYLDSLGNEKVFMGYTLNEVRKLGIGLGLDLKGGMNVTLQVSVPDILRSMASAEGNAQFEQALAATDSIVKAKSSADYISTFVDQYSKLPGAGDLTVVFNGQDGIKPNMSNSEIIAVLKQQVKDRVTNTTNVLRNRIDQYGVVAPNIQELENDGQILLELPGVKEHERVLELMKSAANLEFYETQPVNEISNNLAQVPGLSELFAAYPPTSPIAVGLALSSDRERIDSLLNSPAAKSVIPSNVKFAWEVKPFDFSFADDSLSQAMAKSDYYALIALKTENGKARLSGDVVTSASSDYENTQGNYVSMNMTADAARKWARITADNVGKPVAIVLDDKVYSAPNVNQAIEGGRSQITGHFTVDEAKDLANVLKSGKMAAKIDVISTTIIGPSLGQQAIDAGMLSFVIALVLLMIFMMAFYGVIPGLIANLGLVFNIFFTFGILASFQAVLTLSGIAGIVLALGMAVDANVLIFERAKEELRAGKNVRTAIADGYSNAFSAIFDSNLTSIITGVILLLFGTGPIKGFATTLIIGIICSFFTAVYLTRLVFIIFAKTGPFQRLTFTTPLSRKMFANTSFNFLGARKVSFLVVLACVLVICGSFFVRGLNQGIDFSGGRNYVIQFPEDQNTEELRGILTPAFDGAQVSVITIDAPSKVRVSTNYKIDASDDDNNSVEAEITGKLYNALKDRFNNISLQDFSTTNENVGIMSSQKVGPTVASDMRTDAYIAVSISLLAMFLYILVRFRNVAFSLGALAAVAFTAFTIIGFYSLFWGVFPFAMEIDQSFIAAILTVIGYQINDTVVVFDRVRENVGLYPKQDFFTTINKSINSTLGRTVMTSASTLLVLLCIFILGGDAIRSFVFAMIFGVIIGTLATMFVACPVAYLTDSRRSAGKKVVAAAAAKASKK